METNETTALQREITDLAGKDEIAPHSARRIAQAHGISFRQLLRLGALVLVAVRALIALRTGAPYTFRFGLFGKRWKDTIEEDV